MDYEIRSEGLTDFEIRFRALGEDYRERTRATGRPKSASTARSPRTPSG
jgi:hypothetical protein